LFGAYGLSMAALVAAGTIGSVAGAGALLAPVPLVASVAFAETALARFRAGAGRDLRRATSLPSARRRLGLRVCRALAEHAVVLALLTGVAIAVQHRMARPPAGADYLRYTANALLALAVLLALMLVTQGQVGVVLACTAPVAAVALPRLVLAHDAESVAYLPTGPLLYPAMAAAVCVSLAVAALGLLIRPESYR
jgi:hypothetical protein